MSIDPKALKEMYLGFPHTFQKFSIFSQNHLIFLNKIAEAAEGGNRGEWICKIETNFKTYGLVGRSRAVAEENLIKKCNKDTLSSNCRNATCSN